MKNSQHATIKVSSFHAEHLNQETTAYSYAVLHHVPKPFSNTSTNAACNEIA
jgi:hypothetical protein